MLFPFIRNSYTEICEKPNSVFRALTAIVLIIGLGVPIGGLQFFSERALASSLVLEDGQELNVSATNVPSIHIVVSGKNSCTIQQTTTLASDIFEILEKDYDFDAGTQLSLNVETAESVEINENGESHETTIIKSFDEVVREQTWTAGALRFLINIDIEKDGSMLGSDNGVENSIYLLNNEVHLIQWGSDANRNDAKRLINMADGKGMFLYDLEHSDGHENETVNYKTNDDTARELMVTSAAYKQVDSDGIKINADGSQEINDKVYYAGLLDKFVRYLVDQIPQNRKNSIYVNEPFRLDVEPEILRDNAVSANYPAGRWRYQHDPDYYENQEGYDLHVDPGEQGWSYYSPSIEPRFEKSGRYRVTFDDKIVADIKVHRRPVADFDMELLGNGGVKLTSRAYDLDEQSRSNGLASQKWSYNLTNMVNGEPVADEEWTDGQPSAAQIKAAYTTAIKLTVTDWQGATASSTKYIGDGVPFANFFISTKNVDTNSTLDIQNTSYDPTGNFAVNKYTWQLYKVVNGEKQKLNGNTWTYTIPTKQVTKLDSAGNTVQGYEYTDPENLPVITPEANINLRDLAKSNGLGEYKLGLVVNNQASKNNKSMEYFQSFYLSNAMVSNSIYHYAVFTGDDSVERWVLLDTDYITVEATKTYKVGDMLLQDTNIPRGFKYPTQYEYYHNGQSTWKSISHERGLVQEEVPDSINFYYVIEDDKDITYSLNEGMFIHSDNNQKSYTPGTEIVVENPIRTGFKFVGWLEKASGEIYVPDEHDPARTRLNKRHNIKAAKTRDQVYGAMYGCTIHDLNLEAVWVQCNYENGEDVYDSEGNIIATISPDGTIHDKDGNAIGCVTTDTTLIDGSGNISGYIVTVAEERNVGRIEDDKIVEINSGNQIGNYSETSEMYDHKIILNDGVTYYVRNNFAIDKEVFNEQTLTWDVETSVGNWLFDNSNCTGIPVGEICDNFIKTYAVKQLTDKNKNFIGLYDDETDGVYTVDNTNKKTFIGYIKDGKFVVCDRSEQKESPLKNCHVVDGVIKDNNDNTVGTIVDSGDPYVPSNIFRVDNDGNYLDENGNPCDIADAEKLGTYEFDEERNGYVVKSTDGIIVIDVDGTTPETPSLTEAWTQLDTCEWQINDEGLLTIRPLGNSDSGTIASASPWRFNDSIKSVSSQGSIHVQSCKEMFSGCTNLESADLSNWDVSGSTSTELMFYKCPKLKELNIANWDLSNVESMELMFYRCSNLESLDVSSWNVSNVKNMESTFYKCSSLESIAVSSWNVSKVEDMSQMFFGCSNLTSLDLSSWSISDSTTLKKIFEDCPISSLTLGTGWKPSTGSGLWIPNETGLTGNWVSADASNKGPLTTAKLLGSYDPQTMSGTWVAEQQVWESVGTCEWAISDDGILTIKPACDESEGVLDFDKSPWKGNTAIKSIAVEGNIKIQNCNEMFSGCVNLESADLSNWDMSEVKSTEMMFYKCSNLEELNVSAWDVSNVENMELMFYKCSKLSGLDVSTWDVSNVQNMDLMFYKCSNLEDLDISSWNVSNVEKMKGLFKECSSLSTLDLSDWDVSNVDDMAGIFDDCPVTTLALGAGWKASSNTELWTPEGANYTGNWVSTDANNPGPLSSVQLMSNYDPNSMAGTWTAETVRKPSASEDPNKPNSPSPVVAPIMNVFASNALTGKVTLAQGKSFGLSGKAVVVKDGIGVTAKGKVAYTSSNTGIVKVSASGKVTANKKKTGTAKITITSVDNPANKKVITVKVVKKAKYKAATKILKTSLKTQYKANPSKSYKITVKKWVPASPSNKNFIVSVSPKSKAKVDPSTNKITFLKKGAVKVTIKSASDPKAKMVVKVKVK